MTDRKTRKKQRAKTRSKKEAKATKVKADPVAKSRPSRNWLRPNGLRPGRADTGNPLWVMRTRPVS
jgi:hypothetical protein